MNFKKALIGAGLAGVLVFASSAYAQTLTLINGSTSDLDGVYISASATDDWEENLIEGKILPSGNQLTITINGQYDKFDLRVESKGASEDYTEFPGNTTQITIHGGGQADYQ